MITLKIGTFLLVLVFAFCIGTVFGLTVRLFEWIKDKRKGSEENALD